MTLAPGVRLGVYEITGPLGHGGPPPLGLVAVTSSGGSRPKPG
jgi:hypothetical protein